MTAEEVRVRQIKQVERADELDPGHRQQVNGEQRREDAECEGSEDAVTQGLALLMTRQPEHEDGQHERVVGAEQALQHDQQRDGYEV